MIWFKKNLYAVIVIALVICAGGALVLEAHPWANSPSPSSTASAPQETEKAVSAAGFQNRAGAADEIVKTWEASKPLNSYELALVLNPEDKTMTGTMRFTYVNTEDREMNELHFLLYANSHEKQEYGIFESQDMERAYPYGFSPGSIQISSVTSDSGKIDYAVTGEQNHVLKVSLPKPVGVGQTVALELKYTVKIPNCYGRFGYGDETMSLVNCNPILAVFDKGKWFEYPYYDIGDPFYSETANFKATIETPSDWTIAATGILTRQNRGGRTVWAVDAPGRRDFGFVASNRFEVMQTSVGGVLVRSYYIKGDKSRGRAALDTGAEAIELYDQTYGEYPYAEFSVVEADFFIGGMEYPGMVLIDHSMYNAAADIMTFDLVVAHETGHQWWYSAIGDNEVTTPWLDEGLTEFSTQYFFEKERNAAFNGYYEQYTAFMLNARKGQEGKYNVTMPVYSFGDGLTYSAWVYDRAAAVLQDLREKVGDKKFFAAMKAYYENNRLGVATREDLEKAFEDTTGTELTQWFEEEFNSTGN